MSAPSSTPRNNQATQPPRQPGHPIRVTGQDGLHGSSANPHSRNVQPLGSVHQNQSRHTGDAGAPGVRTSAQPHGGVQAPRTAQPVFDLNPPKRLPPAKLLLAACVLGLVVGSVTLAFALNGNNNQAREGEVQPLSTISPVAVETPQYENGKIPEEELQDIGDGHQLVKPAAQAYKKMITALTEAGHAYTLNSAYRTIEEQEQLVEDLGLLEEGGRAAAVGTSEHGLGTAVDLKLDWDAVEWLRATAATYGFAETIADEPWHWNYVGD